MRIDHPAHSYKQCIDQNTNMSRIKLVVDENCYLRRKFRTTIVSRNGCSSLWMCEDTFTYFPREIVKRCRIYPGHARIRFINAVWINSILPDTNDTVSSKHFFDWRAIESERRFRLGKNFLSFVRGIFTNSIPTLSEFILLCSSIWHLSLSITRYL